MENHRRHKSNSSGDNFTFPAMSPDMELESELADHLFSNGKFLLHTFPLQPRSLTGCTFSRTSSVSSKDSLVSSRSNSTNSRSSTSSSARTSTSEASSSSTGAAMKTGVFPERESRSPVHYCNNYYYLPAQRWQFMAPVPVLNRRTSQRRKGSPEKEESSRRKGCCRRFFRWLVSTCKQCHAMEPSKKEFWSLCSVLHFQCFSSHLIVLIFRWDSDLFCSKSSLIESNKKDKLTVFAMRFGYFPKPQTTPHTWFKHFSKPHVPQTVKNHTKYVVCT